MDLLSRKDSKANTYWAFVVSCCGTSNAINKAAMHGNIPYTVEDWPDPVVHLLLLMSSIDRRLKTTTHTP